jgi:hypothetical protein
MKKQKPGIFSDSTAFWQAEEFPAEDLKAFFCSRIYGMGPLC